MLTRCIATAAVLAVSSANVEELSKHECLLSTRAASYSILTMVQNADMFDTFGDYRDMVLMEDISEAEREQVVQATLCEELCGKGHTYCKSLKRELDDEAFEKMALFKGLLKKKMDMVRPAMNVARNMVRKMMDDAGDLQDSDVDEIDAKLKEVIKENLSVNKLGDLIQGGLDRFGVPIDLKSALEKNPKGIFTMAKNIYTLASEQIKKSSGGDTFDLSQIIPKGLEMVQKFAKEDADLQGKRVDWDNADVDDDFEESDFDDAFFNEQMDDIPAAGDMPDKTEL